MGFVAHVITLLCRRFLVNRFLFEDVALDSRCAVFRMADVAVEIVQRMVIRLSVRVSTQHCELHIRQCDCLATQKLAHDSTDVPRRGNRVIGPTPMQ